jgi:CubicO group peptidase (beta-lactamase class C family)
MRQSRLIIGRLVLMIVILGAASSCSGSPISNGPTYWPTNDWASSTPEEQGVDSEILIEMFRDIEAQELDLHSVLIIRNGYLVLEAYWHPYSLTDVHTMQSITKSVIGFLIGIAIERGEIVSVDARMVDFFPSRTIDNLDELKKSITLDHLLSMTSGLDCEDSRVIQSALRSEPPSDVSASQMTAGCSAATKPAEKASGSTATWFTPEFLT